MNNAEFAHSELEIPVHRAVRWISIFGIVFGLWIAFLVKLNNQGIVLFLAFIGFTLVELVGLLLSFSTIQVNHKSITATILYTKYRINWDEVKTIETDIPSLLNETNFDTGSMVAFISDEKCFPVQLAMLGKEKVKFLLFLEELIDKHQIEVKLLSSAFMKHKNTKVNGGR